MPSRMFKNLHKTHSLNDLGRLNSCSSKSDWSVKGPSTGSCVTRDSSGTIISLPANSPVSHPYQLLQNIISQYTHCGVVSLSKDTLGTSSAEPVNIYCWGQYQNLHMIGSAWSLWAENLFPQQNDSKCCYNPITDSVN